MCSKTTSYFNHSKIFLKVALLVLFLTIGLVPVKGIKAQGYLKASVLGPDFFGSSVAISNDTMVIGAPWEKSAYLNNPTDNSAAESGAAYVFKYDQSLGDWIQQDYLKASNLEAGDFFGDSVAIEDNVIVVGASGEASGDPADQQDNSQPHSGAAYVFKYDENSGDWVQQAYLKAPNPGAYHYLGFSDSVAIGGNTIALGARGEDQTAPNSGAVYVYQDPNNDGDWSDATFVDYLKASDAGEYTKFGDSVSVDGDQLVVGASGESGAAYVFEDFDQDGDWTQLEKLEASDTDRDEDFGRSVQIAGDVIVVGAPGDNSSDPANPLDDSAPESGAAYVFVDSGNGNWSQQNFLKASNIGGGDRFGTSVAVNGSAMIIGAFYEDSADSNDSMDNSAPNSGAAYLFVDPNQDGNWSDAEQSAYLKAFNLDTDYLFGFSVAMDDGWIAVGSPREDNGMPVSGAVYTYHRDLYSDLDGDGYMDGNDNCPLISNPTQSDSDSYVLDLFGLTIRDGFGDICDNCPNDFNSDQADSNENGTGDDCETSTPNDPDQDGIPDSGYPTVCSNGANGECNDNCPNRRNTNQADSNGNGIGDVCDLAWLVPVTALILN